MVVKADRDQASRRAMKAAEKVAGGRRLEKGIEGVHSAHPGPRAATKP